MSRRLIALPLRGAVLSLLRAARLAGVRRLVDALRAAPPLPGVERVLVPGDPEAQAQADRLRDGIELDPVTWQAIADAARSVGVEP